jgi:hypothetical protein
LFIMLSNEIGPSTGNCGLNIVLRHGRNRQSGYSGRHIAKCVEEVEVREYRRVRSAIGPWRYDERLLRHRACHKRLKELEPVQERRPKRRNGGSESRSHPEKFPRIN